MGEGWGGDDGRGSRRGAAKTRAHDNASHKNVVKIERVKKDFTLVLAMV